MAWVGNVGGGGFIPLGPLGYFIPVIPLLSMFGEEAGWIIYSITLIAICVWLFAGIIDE